MKSFVFITGKAKQFQRWELCSQSVLHCRSECRQGTISCKLAVMWAIALKNSALQSTKVHELCFPHLTGKIKLQNYIQQIWRYWSAFSSLMFTVLEGKKKKKQLVGPLCNIKKASCNPAPVINITWEDWFLKISYFQPRYTRGL